MAAMGTGVALSQVQDLARENAALRLERETILQELAEMDRLLALLRDALP